MIPIHAIATNTSDKSPVLPADKLCYLVGNNGLFKQVCNDFYTARVKTDGVGGLATIEEGASLRVPKLPLKLLRQAEAFFAAVFQRCQSEAVVLLLVNPKVGEWQIEVPDQVVHGLRVSYDLSTLPAPPAGFERFGSIHSHANIKAFHSGTDDADETGFDGLHITIGNVDGPIRSFSARWMLAGKEFKANLEDVIDPESPLQFDGEWMNRVQSRCVEDPFLLHAGELWRRDCADDVFTDGDFSTADEYEQYLLAMRYDIEDRLLEVGAFR